MGICNLIMALYEVVAVKPSVIADEIEYGVSGWGEASPCQVSVVLSCGIDRSQCVILPNLCRPVSHSQEQVTLLPVL